MDAKVERRRREADQEVHLTVQRQLQELREELLGKDAKIRELQKQSLGLMAAVGGSGGGGSSLGSTSLIAAQRIKQLESALAERDAEVKALREQAAAAATVAALIGASDRPKSPMGVNVEVSAAADEKTPDPSGSTLAFHNPPAHPEGGFVALNDAAIAALEAEAARLGSRLRVWERGRLQEELSSAADSALRATTPPAVAAAAALGRCG